MDALHRTMIIQALAEYDASEGRSVSALTMDVLRSALSPADLLLVAEKVSGEEG